MAPIFTKIEIKYHILWAKLDVAGIYYANKRVAIVGTTNFFYPELAYKSTFVHLQNIAHLTINSTI